MEQLIKNSRNEPGCSISKKDHNQLIFCLDRTVFWEAQLKKPGLKKTKPIN
jgi:hypothetical protein